MNINYRSNSNSPVAGAARICMPVFSRFTRKAFRCGLYEAQEVLTSTNDVDVIALEASGSLPWRKELQRIAMYHDFSRRLVFMNPGIEPVRLTREYDLFLAVCQSCWDIPYFNAVQGWKEKCKASACWIEEAWAASLPGYKYFLHALRQFDYIFVAFRSSVEPLSKLIGKECIWLPGGVDTLRFRPRHADLARCIDVYSIGRREERIHDKLLESAKRNEIFYLHDTFQTLSDRDVIDPNQHRDVYASLAKRSQYFLVAPGKLNATSETGGQGEVGYRFFEGAAAGAVLIGQKPIGQAFTDLFEWPDAVVEIDPDGSDVLSALADLASRPAYAQSMSRRNTSECLLRHDWIYRWAQILETVGMRPSVSMEGRQGGLKTVAAQFCRSESELSAAGILR